MLYNTLLGCALLFCFLLWMRAITLETRIQKMEEAFSRSMAEHAGHSEMLSNYRKEISGMLDTAHGYFKEIPELANKLGELRVMHAKTINSHERVRSALRHYCTDKKTFEQYLREQERPIPLQRPQTCCARCRHCNRSHPGN